MVLEYIKKTLLSIPELSGWPEMVDLIAPLTDPGSKPCWEYPPLACQAAGGREEQALPGAAAVLCLIQSMHLVDDILDEDPRGLHHQLGPGKVANLALALQAASSRVIEDAGLPPEIRALIHGSLAKAALGTAYGQDMDAGSLEGEENYWRIVEAKTPPLFGTAMFIGAVLGGSPASTAERLEGLGFLIGMMIQISDDLKDAMDTPARPDWQRKWNNLPILYAMTAEHSERLRFLDLLPRIEEPEALAAAQEILFRCGAVSYCAYRVIEFYRTARENLESIPLANPEPIDELLSHLVEPLKSLFRSIGVESPEELLGE
ncbi:MAG: hypothetical protein GY856_49640 [bacterium]|nr:hypothetical protein [bacterium]